MDLYYCISMPLKEVKVLELAGLAPAPFCGMLLSEFGATVIRVDKMGLTPDIDTVSHGKQSVAVNLKHPKGMEVFKKMCKTSDVLIEPFRKGVMEKLGLGPNELLAANQRLIYARLTGYGQHGFYSNAAGHDINYLALSGILSMLGGRSKQPTPPCNLLADFAAGGLMCALGIVLALFERQSSGKGQVIDCSMVEGSVYLASWITRGRHTALWNQPRGKNILDGGAYYYTTYETKDGQWMAVGALEPQFYNELLNGLGLTYDEVPQFKGDFDKYHSVFAEKFKQRTRDEWCKIFDGIDACVIPVLSLEEAEKHPHNVSRNTFTRSHEGDITARPSPLLSRTPGTSLASQPRPVPGQHTFEVLTSFGYSVDELQELKSVGAIGDGSISKL